MIDIYVPVIGNGKQWTHDSHAAEPDKHKDEGPWRPDVPHGIFWRYNDSIPCWTRTARAGQPLTDYARISVRLAETASFPARILPHNLAPIDRLAADMVRAAGSNWNARIPALFKANQKFDYADEPTRTRAADLLAEAVRRGLDPTVAAETAATCNLLTAELSK